MDGEKPKDTDEEERHEKPDTIKAMAGVLVLVVNMDTEFGKVLVGSRVALPARFQKILSEILERGSDLGRTSWAP